MNVLYLKYAVEIAKTGSINKAAENLYMAQPNLSRAIKELENSLGIAIFERTSRGMILTQEGEMLLAHAERVLQSLDEMESMFRDGQMSKVTFSLSVPRSAYVYEAFSSFVDTLDTERKLEITYKETNALDTIGNVYRGECRLGILRYPEQYSKQFQKALEEKNLRYELIADFSKVLIVSKSHPLAEKKDVTEEDLLPYIELYYADLFVPNVPLSDVKREELGEEVGKKMLIYDRASCFSFLKENEKVYFWSEPLTASYLEKNGLVMLSCKGKRRRYTDLFVYRKDYTLSKNDKEFLTKLCDVKRSYIPSEY